MEQTELWIPSKADGSVQPSLFYRSPSKEKRPLLVGLHTWSHGRKNQIKNMLPYAEKLDWNLLLPEFRGSNLVTNPDCTLACGSEFAKQDIEDAIDYVVERENVDPENVFLLGLSGGGHMALLMAGRCPERFRAIGAYVPITDLEIWLGQTTSYKKHIIACCNDDREEMRLRSPITYLDTASRANLKLFHGKFDPTVPVSHSLHYYGEMMRRYPDARVFLDVFDGKHQIDMDQAIYWLESQYKKKIITEVTG